MNCPKCHGPFADRLLNGVPIQACASCGGIWFDRERITAYLGQALERSGQPPALATLRAIERVPTDLVCPACHEKRLMGIKPHGVKIEQCSGCHGVFLDPGEIDLLSLQSISDAVDRRQSASAPLRAPGGTKDGPSVASGIIDFVLDLLVHFY
jgi:Zn-finger nucleic acid-binding protein